MEELKKLNKHLLSHQKSLEYFEDILEDVNHMSILTLKLIKNEPGCFFTLLPNDANLEQLYQFKPGGILPQFSDQEMVVNGCKSTFCWIPDIYKELAKLILDELLSYSHITCVIDDVRSSKRPIGENYNFTDNCTVVFEKEREVYSILTSKNASQKQILECLNYSNAFWHSLGALTIAKVNIDEKTISSEKIEDICANIQVAFVGAYDGEGYLFWEKNNANSGKGFFSELPLIDNR